MVKPARPSPRKPVQGKGGKFASPVDMHERDEDIALSIETLAGLGMEPWQVGLYHNLTTDTVNAHYGEEMQSGAVKANVRVGAALFATATDRKHRGHVSAAIWWTKARMGWSEPDTSLKGSGMKGPQPAAPEDPKSETPVSEFEALLERLRGK